MQFDWYPTQILESIADNIEEIEEEYLVLRDLSKHPNIPDFAGLFLKRGATVEDDQLWFVLEVSFADSLILFREFRAQSFVHAKPLNLCLLWSCKKFELSRLRESLIALSALLVALTQISLIMQSTIPRRFRACPVSVLLLDHHTGQISNMDLEPTRRALNADTFDH